MKPVHANNVDGEHSVGGSAYNEQSVHAGSWYMHVAVRPELKIGRRSAVLAAQVS